MMRPIPGVCKDRHATVSNPSVDAYIAAQKTIERLPGAGVTWVVSYLGAAPISSVTIMRFLEIRPEAGGFPHPKPCAPPLLRSDAGTPAEMRARTRLHVGVRAGIFGHFRYTARTTSIAYGG